ncbi:hypothetical protein D3C85_648310 [compost metagenome]
MQAHDLVGRIARLTGSMGNLPILLQSDGEGNAYDYARGASFAYVTKDLESTFETLAEAVECGLLLEDLEKVIVVYP